MTAVFTGTIYHTLKETLDQIVDDKGDNLESKSTYKKWVEERTMKDHWEEDQEMSGPGLAAQTAEGADIPTGTVREGYRKRYSPRKYGLRLIISQEAMEDKKYDEAIRFASRLKRAMFKTVDIDVTDMLVYGYDTSYVGGDGLPLWSDSHTLANGGTWSNKMAVAMSPSRMALIVARSQILKYPGHDGVTEGYEMARILCPTEQWGVWEGILGSAKAPEAGSFNEVNVVSRASGVFKGPNEIVPIKWWNNTTTNWAIQTDCDAGFNQRWRRKPKSNTWVDNSHELMNYSITARWDNGWSDARCTLGVQA